MNFFKVPYRPFFLTGTLGLLIGLGVWVVFGLFNPDFYMGQLHARYMIGVFLLSFVIGFLMTAIPNMSKAPSASKGEIFLQLVPLLFTAFFGILENEEKYFFASVIGTLLVLFVFCGRRILSCTHKVPDVFPMVILSLLSGLVGSMFFLVDMPYIGGRLFYLNLILGLCVGVGAKLVPMLLRLGCSGSYSRGEMWIVGGLLAMSCFVEAYWNESYGTFLRFLVMTWVLLKYWKVYIFNGFNTALSVGVRFAALSIFLGTLGLWVFPAYRLESLHVLYVSGFALLTIMVASRVILAHGNFDLNLEMRNWFIRIPVALIILAAATRVSAVFIEGSYEKHLAYAAASFLIAVVMWGCFFIPKLFKRTTY